MGPRVDLKHQRFGRLLVLVDTPKRASDGSVVWCCQCDCGLTIMVSGTNLKSGNTESCGCLKLENQQFGSLRHQHSANGVVSPTYTSWANMIQRCTNPNVGCWEHYGGRGISVCQRWMKFENFLADMGEKPPGLLLDRENNERGYEPGNCRWVDSFVSNQNRRSVKKG